MDLRDSILGFGARQRFDAKLRKLDLRVRRGDPAPVVDADLAELPPPAQRYLRFMGVIGRPREQFLRARFRGQFRMKPDASWLPFDARQFNSVNPIARIADMRIDVARVLPMFGTDSYLGGVGRMHGTLLGLFTVADGAGLEFNLGELVTWVNDAVMLAPSMLLTAAVRWGLVDDDTFELVVTDHGNTVTARVLVDPVGRPVEFITDDRWYAGATPPLRARWTTPFEGWARLPTGRPVPTGGGAVWHLPDGPFEYVRGTFDPASIQFVTPHQTRGDELRGRRTP